MKINKTKSKILTRVDSGDAQSAGLLHVPVGAHGADLRGHQQATHVLHALGGLVQLSVHGVLARRVDLGLREKQEDRSDMWGNISIRQIN